MGIQQGLFIYLLLITEKCLLLKGSPGFLPWKSSQKFKGRKMRCLVWFFPLKFLLWQKYPSPVRDEISAQPQGSVVWQISLVLIGAAGIFKRAATPWFRNHLGHWDRCVEVVHALSSSRKPPSDSWRRPGLCDLALTPWKAHGGSLSFADPTPVFIPHDRNLHSV